MASLLSLVNKCNKFKLKIQLSPVVEIKSKSLIQRTNRWATVAPEKWKTRSIDHRKTWLAETLTEKLFIQLLLIIHFRFITWEWLIIKDHSITLRRTSFQLVSLPYVSKIVWSIRVKDVNISVKSLMVGPSHFTK